MYTHRTLALVLAAPIGLVTAAALYLVVPRDVKTVLTVGGVTFLVAFFFISAGLKKLLFDAIQEVYSTINQLLHETVKQDTQKIDQPVDNPLQGISESIDLLLSLKQKEIDGLRKLETFRTDFVADVSHELKTPIFAAQGFIHTLLDGAINDETVRVKFLKRAAKNLDGLNTLVQDLLTLSQIEMGNVKMKFDNIDLYRLCREVVDQVEQRGAQRNIIVEPPSDEKLLIVRADWFRITQVMTNLVSNAIKYTDDKGSITIRFEQQKNAVTTIVSDNGIGIPSSHLERIFQRFYRVEKSRSKEKGGTGLGLSIVKHILEEHNTKVHVESHVGEGSTFSFQLPVAGQSGDVSDGL